MLRCINEVVGFTETQPRNLPQPIPELYETLVVYLSCFGSFTEKPKPPVPQYRTPAQLKAGITEDDSDEVYQIVLRFVRDCCSNLVKEPEVREQLLKSSTTQQQQQLVTLPSFPAPVVMPSWKSRTESPKSEEEKEKLRLEYSNTHKSTERIYPRNDDVLYSKATDHFVPSSEWFSEEERAKYAFVLSCKLYR